MKKLKFSSLNTKKREKLSNLIFDVVKYMITVILAALLFNHMDDWKWYNFLASIVLLIALIIIAFILIDDTEESKK